MESGKSKINKSTMPMSQFKSEAPVEPGRAEVPIQRLSGVVSFTYGRVRVNFFFYSGLQLIG